MRSKAIPYYWTEISVIFVGRFVWNIGLLSNCMDETCKNVFSACYRYCHFSCYNIRKTGSQNESRENNETTEQI